MLHLQITFLPIHFFRHFPLSLYTFLLIPPISQILQADSYDMHMYIPHSKQAWLGVGIWIAHWLSPYMALTIHEAFADFGKIHPSAHMPGPLNPGVIAVARDVLPPFGCEIPSFQVTALDRSDLVVVLRPHFSVVPFMTMPVRTGIFI